MRNVIIRATCLSLGLALGLGAAGEAHAAATANFQGLCNWNAAYTQFTCNFDANRPASSPSSCPDSFVWKYQWDFDDGSTVLTGNPVVSHAFPSNADRLVNLKVVCWSGETAQRSRHVCTQVGTLGCIQVDGIWH